MSNSFGRMKEAHIISKLDAVVGVQGTIGQGWGHTGSYEQSGLCKCDTALDRGHHKELNHVVLTEIDTI